jgi:hypothetical protein
MTLLETTCSTLRKGLDLFDSLLLPLVPSMLDSLAASFQRTEVSGFIWIVGRIADLARQAGNGNSADDVQPHLKKAFEVITEKIIQMLSKSSLDEIQDCKFA